MEFAFCFRVQVNGMTKHWMLFFVLWIHYAIKSQCSALPLAPLSSSFSIAQPLSSFTVPIFSNSTINTPVIDTSISDSFIAVNSLKIESSMFSIVTSSFSSISYTATTDLLDTDTMNFTSDTLLPSRSDTTGSLESHPITMLLSDDSATKIHATPTVALSSSTSIFDSTIDPSPSLSSPYFITSSVEVFTTVVSQSASAIPSLVPVYPQTPNTTGLLGNMTSLTSLCTSFSGSSGCCAHALSQVPAEMSFEESKPAGLVLAEIKDVANISLVVRVHKPASLKDVLPDLFNMTSSGTTYSLVVTQTVDLEALYKEAGNDPRVNRVVLRLECSDQDTTAFQVPPRYVNVTIVDVDDTLPVFDHPDADSGCVVPVYTADTSEDYMGELSMSPGTIRAVDGDMTSQNNISYSVMHSEPEDYYIYFDVDMETGIVNKTHRMNASENGKYVLFVKASEDSPQMKSRVAVVSINVLAPSPLATDGQVKVNPVVKLSLQFASVAVFLIILCGIIVLIHHRYRLKHRKIRSVKPAEYDGIAMTRPRLALYKSPETSRSNSDCDVTSPSHVTVADSHCHLQVPEPSFVGSSRRSSLFSNSSQKKKKVIVKKPLDTKLRPGWNAPTPKPKRAPYQPFKDWKTGS